MGLTNLQVGIWNVLGANLGLIGDHYWVDPINGGDGNNGSKDAPFATLYKAHLTCIDKHNDVVHLVSDGTAASAARLSVALALSGGSPTPTVGTLVWSKSATHLVGECAPSASKRARIAPQSTDTVALFGSGNFMNVTGYGCMFKNIQIWGGFATGGAAEITLTDQGRNYYEDVEILGQADVYAAGHTDSRSLLCTGTVGSSIFRRCIIGTDAVARTAATKAVEFAAGTPRNKFFDCEFPIWGTTVQTQVTLYSAGANSMDRYQLFERCKFLNAAQSGGVTITSVATVGASPGGIFVFKDPMLVGFTGYGPDAATRGVCWVVGAQGTSNATLSSSGIANTPVA